jgi:hypothetical protein
VQNATKLHTAAIETDHQSPSPLHTAAKKLRAGAELHTSFSDYCKTAVHDHAAARTQSEGPQRASC